MKYAVRTKDYCRLIFETDDLDAATLKAQLLSESSRGRTGQVEGPAGKILGFAAGELVFDRPDPSIDIPTAVAAALTNEALADRLYRLSSSLRWCDRYERDGYLIEAARRLDPSLRPNLDTITTDC